MSKPEQYEIQEAILVLVKLLDDYHLNSLIDDLYRITDERQ